MLSQNIENIKKEIGDKALLIAVSKTVSAEVMNEAAECGITDFGENYAAELCDKYEFLRKDKIKLHFIGHLQTNKVKYIVDKVCMIQSVDSFRLAAEIDKQCAKRSKTMDILIQVNVGDEAQKSGAELSQTENLIKEIEALKNVRVRGLMAIPPFDREPAPYFEKMRMLFDKLKANGFDMQYLSMGMSADYMTAIDYGANIVRVGTKIFGARDYSKR